LIVVLERIEATKKRQAEEAKRKSKGK